MAYGAPKGDNWVGVGTTTAPPTRSGAPSPGLTGTAVLENNAGNDLSTSTNGAFTFSTALAGGSAYNVTVKTNPSGQACTVTNPSGTIAAANVTNVSISCVTTVVPTYTVGGTIAGLTGTAVLENNAGNDLSTSTNGAFTFSTALAQGSAYNVTVKTNPSGQACTVTNPSGTIAAANVTNVSISCVTTTAPTYTVGGTIAGLTGTVVLENNAGNDLSTSTNGAFTFSTALGPGLRLQRHRQDQPFGTGLHGHEPLGHHRHGQRHQRLDQLCDHDRAHLHGRGHHRRAHRHGGPREQRRQRPEHQHQRRLHLQHPLGRGLRLQRHRQDQPFGTDLHGHEPLGHHRRGQRHQRLDQLCDHRRAGSVSDNFNRANGTLGAGWTDMSDGGMAISSQVVVGTKSSYSGDIRTGETYASDQSSQIEVTSTQLSGGQWIGAAVRAQNSGQNLYLGLYFWNNGNPELMLFKRISGNWTQLGASSFQGALAAGTQLNLSVAGSTLTFSQNGVARITATDTSLTGGAPGIMAYGTPKGDNWVGAGTTGSTYTVGGTITGLTGTAVLENNAGNDLSTSTNGAFTFSTPLAGGSAYNVTVKTNPSGQTCTVTNPSGTIATANVTNVSISCVTTTAPTYTVGAPSRALPARRSSRTTPAMT